MKETQDDKIGQRLFHRLGVLAAMLPLMAGLAGGVPTLLAGELELREGRPFCQAYACDGLLSEAQSFRVSDVASLPILEALRGGEIFAYLFLSTDLVDIPGYSGKPLVTLIAMDTGGTLLDAKVVHHSEPILLVGIPESKLNDYLQPYRGRHVTDTSLVSIKPAAGTKPPSGSGKAELVHMITGATVTALVLEETLLASARKVARGLGLIPQEVRRIVTWQAGYAPKSWQALLDEGSIGHLRVEAKQMDSASTDERPWIDLYFGDLTQPIVGMNILGERTYDWLKGELKEGEHALFIVANGISSFKGSGFVRGGIFDRFHLTQGLEKFTFKDLDYENLYALRAEGAPRFKESGLFFLRDRRFEATRPWEFAYIANRLTGETAVSKDFKFFTASYHLPQKYYQVRELAGEEQASLIERIWRDRLPEAISLSLLLLAVMGVFFLRRVVTASARRLEWIHIAVLVAALAVVGVVLRAPPSVTQLFPLLQVFSEDFRWGLFLSDPLLFVFWTFIAVSLLLWGRGWFCGWVCPYGALLELVYAVSRRVLPKRLLYELPQRGHDLLRRLRYVILAGLVVLSVFSLEWTERLSEVEPFKTTWIVGVFNREWYLTLYWWVLLIASVFTFRFFCRYICPLGAALSIGSALRLIGIKRKDFCTRCKICTRGCDSRAIDAQGAINRYECLYCMECEQKYHDDWVCPPLIVARRQVEKAAGGNPLAFRFEENSPSGPETMRMSAD